MDRGGDRFGVWTNVVCEVVAYDVDRGRHIYRTWLLEEMLMAFLHRLKQEAMDEYKHTTLVWAAKTSMGGKSKPPQIPDILK